MKTFVYPGTFDPFTNGHLDIARRASRLCDRLVVAVLQNSAKHPTFQQSERVEMVRQCLEAESGARRDLTGEGGSVATTAEAEDLAQTTAWSGSCQLEVCGYDGLLVDFMREQEACAIVRGLRSESDFRFEAELAAVNRLMYPNFELLLLPCRPDLGFTSSSIVREVASYGGDISGMVPAVIVKQVMRRFQMTQRGEVRQSKGELQ